MKSRRWYVAALCFCLVGVVGAQTFTDPFAEGREAFEAKKYEEALAKFRRALEIVPGEPTILSWVGAANMQLARYAEAEAALTEAVAKGGTAYQFFELLAKSQIHQGKWDAALATIRRYREVAPEAEKQENEEKLRALESALHLEKRLECLRADPPNLLSADAELETAWKLNAKDPAQYVSFAQIWTSKALAEKDPVRKAEYYARAEAAARAWVASAADAAEKIRAKTALGTVLVRQKKYDEAITVLDEASKAEPSNCALKLQIARAYLGKEDFRQAKAMASEAIDCAPAEPQGYLLRATAEYQLEDCPSVVKDGAQFAQRAPGKEEPKFITYCKSVIKWERAQADRQKHADDYKKWILQQLEEGDKAVEESIGKPKKDEKKNDKNGDKNKNP